MAIGYLGIANTPCCVLQTITALVGDGADRFVRVGGADCPLPAGWTLGNGSPVNSVFFDKMKAAARRITGAADDAGLSGLTIPAIFFLAQGPNASREATLAGLFPNGQLLTAPLIEQIGLSNTASNSAALACVAVVFETRAEGPRYCDFYFTVTAANGTLNFVIKLFHTVTM